MTDKQLAVLINSHCRNLLTIQENIAKQLNNIDGIEYRKNKYGTDPNKDDLTRPVILSELEYFIYCLNLEVKSLSE